MIIVQSSPIQSLSSERQAGELSLVSGIKRVKGKAGEIEVAE